MTGDVNANRGDDTVTLETGVQIGGTIYGSGCEYGAKDNVDTLIFGMSTYNAAEYNAAKNVIAGATDELKTYEFSWDGGFIRWQYFDTLIDKLTLLFKSESKPDAESKPAVTVTLIFVEEGLLKVYQNDVSGTLRFYGLEDDGNTFIAELAAYSWENARPGDVLIDVENLELDTHLVVTMLENGQMKVEYFSLADGTLLFSEIITP